MAAPPLHSSAPAPAAAVFAVLTCGRPGCPCAASARQGTGLVHCPVLAHGQGHGDRRPSLSIRPGDRAILITCFVGCPRPAVVAAIRDRLGGASWTPPPAAPPRPAPDPAATLELVAHLWREAEPDHPRLRAYLRHRGLTGAVPPALRLHPACLYVEPGAPRRFCPAMLGRFVTPRGEVTGILRTFLDPNGPGKAQFGSPKKMLGRTRGAALHLAQPTDGVLAVAEGLETALAVMEGRGVAAWAAGSAGGLAALVLPDGLVLLQVFADPDPDPAGRAAAAALAARVRARGVRAQVFVPCTTGAA